MTNAARKLIGVISDTHGLVRPQAIEALAGADLVLHAGDIGNQEVLDTLNQIAPVIAVRGNNDKGEWAQSLPHWEVVEIGSVSIYLLHDLKQIDISPTADVFRVVVSGHSHKPVVEERRGVIYLNPGSAGPRRFTLPVSVAHLHIVMTRYTLTSLNCLFNRIRDKDAQKAQISRTCLSCLCLFVAEKIFSET